MNDPELLKLCEDVYNLTNWDGYELSKYHVSTSDGYDEWDLPLYTSDYILEKLIDKEPWVGMTLTDGWIAHTKNWNVRKGGQYVDRCGSALNALLNLVIALHKAGELS